MTPAFPDSATPPARADARTPGRAGTVGVLLAFSVLWIDLVRMLSHTWQTREQYSYGWFVPIFGAYLFASRWLDRPTPQPGPGLPAQSALVTALLCGLLPLRVVFEINADWPLLAWPYTAIVVVATLHGLFLAGGLRWVRHFGFPVAFILVAVAWPYRIEYAATQSLMRVASAITVELLSFFGFPALQRGNLIEVATGVVGIDEACSGIRSFQSTIMAGLLMGELYRLRLLPRVAFVVIGIVIAFGFNIVRTVFLSWQASANGAKAVDKWHDSAGLTILVACFFSLWLLARRVRSRWSDVKPSPRLPAASSDTPNRPSPLPSLVPRARRFLLGAGVWALACLLVTEGWYRWRGGATATDLHWAVDFPTNKATFQTIELPRRTTELLAYDNGMGAKWTEDGDAEWTTFFFQWRGHTVQSIMAARYHRPEVCLPASGLEPMAGSKTSRFKAGDLELPMRQSAFSGGGQVFYVFYCLWQDGDERRTGIRMRGREDRLIGAIEGRRRIGQQVLEIILSGCSSLTEAEHLVREKLPGMVRVVEKGGLR